MAVEHIWSRDRAERFVKLGGLVAGHPWNYTEGSRRGSIVRGRILNPQLRKWNGKLYEDCSSTTVGLAYAAGLPDPAGLEYLQIGNTWSLANHLTHINSNEVLPGDLVIYQNPENGSQHVVTVLKGKGHTATCVSFGSPPGPRLRSVDYRTDYLTGLIYASPHLGLR